MPMKTVDALVAEIRELQQGEEDQSLMMYGHQDGGWHVHIGNPSQHVLLGEIDGVIKVEGKTLREALIAGLNKLKETDQC